MAVFTGYTRIRLKMIKSILIIPNFLSFCIYFRYPVYIYMTDKICEDTLEYKSLCICVEK